MVFLIPIMMHCIAIEWDPYLEHINLDQSFFLSRHVALLQAYSAAAPRAVHAVPAAAYAIRVVQARRTAGGDVIMCMHATDSEAGIQNTAAGTHAHPLHFRDYKSSQLAPSAHNKLAPASTILP
jgi:hypothetical protein